MKISSLVTIDRVTAAGFLFALGLSLFIGAEAHAVDPLKDKPVENADGTLSFEGLSDRQVLEFTANQVWLANRRASKVETQNLHSLLEMIHQHADTIEQIQDLSKMVDEAERQSVQTYLPNMPDDTSNFGRYLYKHQ